MPNKHITPKSPKRQDFVLNPRQKELEQFIKTMGMFIAVILLSQQMAILQASTQQCLQRYQDKAGVTCGARSETHFPEFCLKGRWQDEIVGLILEDGEYLYLGFVEEFDLTNIQGLIKRRRI